MAPGPNTSRPHPEHPVFPYLLRNLEIVRPDQKLSRNARNCILVRRGEKRILQAYAARARS